MAKKTLGVPTIADVARECGVGAMTVSRVLNGGRLVRPATALKVQKAIKKLGYEPNEAARILKGQVAKTIGLIIPDLADPFFSICAHAVQETAAEYGYTTLLLASERDRDGESRDLSIMRSRNIAGLLIVPSSPSCAAGLRELQTRGVPIIFLDRTFPGINLGAVTVENQQGAQRAVNHLLEHGYRTVFCVGYDRQYNSIAQRIRGYEKEMIAAGLKPQFILAEDVSSIAPQVLRRLRSTKSPAALFTLNNVTTVQVLQAFRREGINVPQEFAIIGFDDLDLAPLLAVPLTAVRQPASEIGRTATRLLLQQIRTGASDNNPIDAQITLATELVIRRSCGCQPTPI